MASWAKPGIKCVCVDDANWRLLGGPPWTGPLPTKGSTYTVEIVEARSAWGTMLTLTEFGCSVRFRASRFRPLVTQEEDVAMFKRIANDVPLKEMIEAGLYPIH